jgi:glycerol kinase
MSARYILVFDHGTTSVRTCLMDVSGRIVARSQETFDANYPQSGWVEHDAELLWSLTLQTGQAVLQSHGTNWSDIAAVGLTNQRETTILWDVETGKPVHSAIVWQCRRTADYCEALKQAGHADTIQAKTGLVVDAYFSASKIRWLLDNVPETAELIRQNRLRFGTVDTWILWKLSGGKVHVTDYTNASRTMLYNIHDKRWDPDLLALFDIPTSLLPVVKPSNVIYGHIDPAFTEGVSVSLAGLAGDQQAALHGQKCWTPGLAKSTYGTGAFLVMNTGVEAVQSRQGLLTTLGTDAEGQPAYALEGAIFIAGAAIEWLSRRLELIADFQDIDTLAESLPDNGGVYLVPAFVGLGAPYWDANARGAMFGLTQDTGKAHLVRAAVEAMVYQTREVLDSMQAEAHLSLEALRVDGGVTRSRFLVQFLADILNVPVLRSDDAELTAKGAGYLAGLAVGFWQSPDDIAALSEETERFEPKMPAGQRDALMAGWRNAVQRTLSQSFAKTASCV